MGEIVNLRRVKKTRVRAAAAADAAANRAKAGMAKAERVAEAKRKAVSEAVLDGAKLKD